jgi:hypothetical protein
MFSPNLISHDVASNLKVQKEVPMSKLKLLLLALTGALAVSAGGMAHSAQIVWQDGKCLDVRGGGTVEHTPVQIWDCQSGNPNQEWVIDNGSLVGIGGQCLDVPDGRIDNGVRMQMFPCHGGPNQRWTVLGGHIFTLGSKCLDGREGRTFNANIVQTWECQPNNPNQQWTIR